MRRRETPNRGYIRADELYTADGVMAALGIGRNLLMQARATGIVKALFVSGVAYYDGAEIIEWIKTTATSEPKNGRAKKMFG